MSTNRRKVARLAAAAGVTTLTLFTASSAALATTGDAVTNGSFNAPGTEAAVPTGWTPTPFDNETAPYSANIGTYDSNGQYAPPAGTPGGDAPGNFADEDFYDVGGSTGVEGFGGAQTFASPVVGTDAPDLSWATAQSFAPSPTSAAWAGSMVEVDLTSGTHSYQLRYINPFTPGSGSYSAAPTSSNTSTTKYVVLTALASKQWYVQAPVNVATDVLAQFGTSSLRITGVRYGNIENATSTSPYPNMTSYWKNISLFTAGAPTAALAESPLAVGLPLAGVAGAGFVLWFRRRSTV